jgi:TolB protein
VVLTGSKSVIVAAMLLLAVPATASAAWPGLNGRVALTQNPQTKDVFAVALDGTSTQLTFTGNVEEQSTWAPDGRRIAYKRSDEVFIRDVTTNAAPVRLTNKAVSAENNTQPGWSPDGRSIVFRTNRANPTVNVADIWIMDADGTDERPLIVQDEDQRYPALSPDGRLIAYTSRNARDADLWVANADGTGAHLVYDSGVADSAPAWSPDSTRLAFEQHDPGESTNGDIFVLDVGNGDVARLTDDPAHDEGPAWSPDGSMIAFTSQRSDPRGDIWIMQSDSGEQRRLTSFVGLDESPDWQPIPTSLTYIEPCGGTVVTDNPRHCPRARKLTPDTPGCVQSWHSFDQTLVECGNDAFVKRG